MPKAPGANRPELARRFAILIIGLVLTIAFTALGVDILDGWESRRDPLVPAAATFATLGGIAAAYLIVTRRTGPVGIGAILLILSAALVFFMHLRRGYVEGDDLMLDFFAVGAAILFVVATVYLVIEWMRAQFASPPPPAEDEG